MYSNDTVIGPTGSHPKERSMDDFKWPSADMAEVPDWIYTSQLIYDREVDRVFHGRTWNFVALEAEIPDPGCYKRSYIGPTPVVVSRDKEGGVHVFENRCAHRGVEFCREPRGKAQEFVCPYHQWSYDLKGNLRGVPFKRGVKGEGGMPPDFRNEQHGLRRFNVTVLHGVVFASFSDDVEPIEDYLGAEILEDFNVVFKGKKLRIHGYYRNELPGNWKLYHENLKDPYHATLLHSYLVTFGLVVAGNRSAMIVDPTGRHGTIASAKGDDPAAINVDADSKGEMRSFHDGMKLHDEQMLRFVKEFDSPWSVAMQTIWPNLIVQRELNTLGIRHIVPNGPNSMIMLWILFGYEDDSDEMTRHRLRQGNLMGPSGFLGVEDNEAIKFLQEGVRRSPTARGLLKLGTGEGGATTLITESAIRGMYRQYRETMGL
ncbi:Rieske 2Fe-2S domain-containing protein [Pigmentiphaga sp.]|uniref:Rieske 2Fe-2S domain-containing protein n=1 Tax=Pigmentiphaga sp. TaxID=1977564 RepID=UPI00128D3D55|nr:Rieske 2Fe-2S domain-containing protein [Pigmentiphaga sp.]MPS26176.1 biphenyl 2,3-dioxygenase [Alcaligenaceae bacterium SAGV5]MPS53211.1 biphenyl 2,3-dioxygenase [Alcaligenaceae bacterium SAGV3]MPT55351.1 biphenyl 2,3-dioxygenase [Alcaligenaceae bacterium]